MPGKHLLSMTLVLASLAMGGFSTRIALCQEAEENDQDEDARQEEPEEDEEGEGVQMHEHHGPARDAGPHRPTGELRSLDDFCKAWLGWEHATGDWGGARPWLDEHGMTFELSYSANFLQNLHGGLNTRDANQYRGLLDLSLTLDTEAMGLWEGGTIFLDFLEIHGRDISERHVGDFQALSNNDAPARTQLSEFWYEHSFFDGKVRIKLGKMDSNADFVAVDYGGEFIGSSAAVIPTVPMPTFPDPNIGFALFYEPVEWLALGAGVYDTEGVGGRAGFDTAFHDSNDSFSLVELKLRPTFNLWGQDLPGVYRVGGWYHSGSWDVFFNDIGGRLKPRTHRGNAGLYLSFDQELLKENPSAEDDEQGLGAFFQFGWAPSSYNEITRYYGVGFQYVGLIPGRDEDVTGLAMYHASLSGKVQSLERRHSETAVELYHKLQLTPSLSLKPDIQYIVNPGGDGKDAIVAGVRLEIAF